MGQVVASIGYIGREQASELNPFIDSHDGMETLAKSLAVTRPRKPEPRSPSGGNSRATSALMVNLASAML